jgi:asparagine synthetase B (glutamine-hydrolysing)
LAQKSEGGFFGVANEDGSIVVQLLRRDAYPKTYCYGRDDGSYVFGYGMFNDVNSEFLECAVWPDGRMSIRRDSFGTLPLFYGDDDTCFAVSNEYSDLQTVLHCTISEHGLLDALAVEMPMGTTYAEQIKVLWEDLLLTREANGVVSISRQQYDELQLPKIDPGDFNGLFNKYLDDFITTRLDGQLVAFEASGGLDSATLHQYYAQKNPESLSWMASLLYRDEFQLSQENKIKKLANATASHFVYQALDSPRSQFPLARMLTTGDYVPTFFEKTYFEPTLSYVKKLAAADVQVICTGVGGDELFSNITIESRNVETRRAQLPVFTTTVFRDEYLAARSELLESQTGRVQSASYASLCNNLYINHGVWPVSPFLSSALYQIVKRLPIHFRANKNILRAYHQAHGFIPEIYNPVRNENFSSYFRDCFCAGGYDAPIRQLVQNAVSVRRGYVDPNVLIEAYERVKTEYSEPDAFDLYMWMTTEISLQSLS